jgi:fructokinase
MALVTAGECLVDLIRTSDGLLKPHLGGSPYNFSLALARLGRRVAYVNPLSQDAFGEQFLAALTESGVRLLGGRSVLPTSLAVVQVDTEGKPAYGFYREGVADRDFSPLDTASLFPRESTFFHVGSLALLPPDGDAWGKVLVELIADGVTTSVDVNMRPQVCLDRNSYAHTVRSVMRAAHILKVSDEDLLALDLTGGDPVDQARALLTADTQPGLDPSHRAVTRVVLLTLGARGAYALTLHDQIFQAAPEVVVADTVGAGDCFYAGFIARLDELHALDRTPTADELTAALALGSAVAAYNLQHAGCQPPRRHEIGV